MARFFALVANGGKVVTPHVVAAVEQTGGRERGADGRAAFQPPPPVDSGVDPTALDVIQSALYDATHASYGTATSVFGNFPVPDRRQDGHGREGRPAARLRLPAAARPVVVVRLRAGRQPDDRGLRRDRERRPRRHRRRARRARGVRAATSRRRRRRSATSGTPTDGRVRRHRPGHAVAAAGRGRSRARTSGRSSRGSTGCCSPPRARSSPSGSGRSPASRSTTSPASRDYFLTRQLVFAAHRRRRCMVAAIFVDPAWYRRWKRRSTACMIGLMVLVVLVGDRGARLRRWIDARLLPLPAVRVREAAVRPLHRRLPRRPDQAHRGRADAAAGDRARDAAGAARLPPAGPRQRARLPGRARGLPLRRRRALGAPRRARGAHARGVLAALWILPAAGHRGAEAVPDRPPDRLPRPDEDPQGTTWNQRQSITAVGSGGFSGRGVDEATQTRLDYLPEHATDFAFASLSEQRGFVGAAILLLLYLLVVWRGLKIVTIARDAFSAIVAAGIVFALLFQIFVNVGMATGVAPVTGITLPS